LAGFVIEVSDGEFCAAEQRSRKKAIVCATFSGGRAVRRLVFAGLVDGDERGLELVARRRGFKHLL